MSEAARATRIIGVVGLLARHYFRVKFIDEDSALDKSNEPVIYASNHSGMNFPWDAHMLYEHLIRTQKQRGELRPLVSPYLLKLRVMSLFALPNLWPIFGSPATTQDFERLMQKGTNVMINPEGVAGIGKGFNHRYELQRFSSSFVRMSLKHNRKIIPVSVVNAEYMNPLAYSFGWLNRLTKKIGLPFLPVGPTLFLCAIFPFVAYIGLPARVRYVFGKALRPSDLTGKKYEDLSDEEIRSITERVQSVMQLHLNESVANYGRPPFAFGELLKEAWRMGRRAWVLLPLSWPILFYRAHLGEKFSRRNGLISALTCLGLILPVIGWPILFFAFAFKTELVETKAVQNEAA